MTAITVTSISNVSTVNALGVLSPNYIRLTLAEAPPANLNADRVFFALGSTNTLIKGSTGNYPWQVPSVERPRRKVLTNSGEIIIVGAPSLDQDYLVRDVVDDENTGSLLFNLRNGAEPLAVLHDSTNNPLGGQTGEYLVLDLRFSLTDNETDYRTSSGTVVVETNITPITVQDLIDFGFKQRFQDSIYNMTPTLSLAWTKSEEFNYLAQLKIANTLFEYMGYTDETEYDLLSLDTDNEQERIDVLRFTSNINPYAVRGFVQHLNDNAEDVNLEQSASTTQIEVVTTENDRKELLILQTFSDNGVDSVLFDRLGILLKIGDRLRVNTKDYLFNFEVLVTDLDTKRGTGIAYFNSDSGDLNIDNLTDTNNGRYVLGYPPVGVTVGNEVKRFEVIITSLDQFADQIVRVANLRPNRLLLTLTDNVVLRQEIVTEDLGVPPGIGNSSRANVSAGVPSGFEAIREINNPYPPTNYCNQFKTSEECLNVVDRVNLNYRSDGLNRNPFATVDDFRYTDELALGLRPAIVETNPLKSQLYQQYWEEFQSRLPTHGCLEFQRTGRPELVAPCLAVQRCSRQSPNNLSRVFSCVRETIGGFNK